MAYHIPPCPLGYGKFPLGGWGQSSTQSSPLLLTSRLNSYSLLEASPPHTAPLR